MKLWKVKLNQFNQPYGIIVSFSTAKVARKEFWFTPDITGCVYFLLSPLFSTRFSQLKGLILKFDLSFFCERPTKS